MAATQHYEFSLSETSTLDDLASWMAIVAIASITLGTLDLAAMVYALGRSAALSAVATAVAGVAWILVGTWLRGAANAMRAVTLTEGNDMAHFMSALAAMRKVYLLQAVFVALNAVAAFGALLGR